MYCVAWQWGGEMCHVWRACTLETHARQHISKVLSSFPYMEDNSSQRDELGQSDFNPFESWGFSCLWLAVHGFVVWQLKAKKARASIDKHDDTFSAHLFFYALMRITNYAHVAICRTILKHCMQRRDMMLACELCKAAAVLHSSWSWANQLIWFQFFFLLLSPPLILRTSWSWTNQLIFQPFPASLISFSSVLYAPSSCLSFHLWCPSQCNVCALYLVPP